MKVLTILILFSTIIFIGSYADTDEERWKLHDAAGQEDAKYYYDRESLDYRSKYFFTVWEKIDYKTPERKKSIKNGKMVKFSLHFLEIDCIHKKSNLRIVVHFGIDNDLISFSDFNNPHWIHIIQDSDIENLYFTLCPLK